MSKTKSFRTKLWLYFILFAAFIFAILWILQTVFLQSFYNGMLAENTRAAAEEISVSSKDENFTSVIDALSADNSLLVFVTDKEGTIIYSSDSYKSYYHSQEDYSGGEDNPYHKGEEMNWQIGNYRNLPDGYDEFLSALSRSENGTVEYKTDSQYVCGRYIETADGKQMVLYVSAALGAVGATASIIRIQLLWVTALSLVLAFLIAWFLARKFAVPVGQLYNQAKMLADEHYESKFEKGFCLELDELSNALDQTAGELAEAKRYQKKLLANVSHDLRTPLTMIKGYAEMVRDISWENEAQRVADTGIIIREADRLTALVNEILEYSSLQNGKAKKEFSEVDFSILVKKVVEQFEPLINYSGGAIESNIEEGCVVNGDSALLTRAVYNLVDNAVRHMGEDRKVIVFVKKRDGIILEVIDHGAGIDEKELLHIWEKYYTSRQRGNKGASGLGLAIVKEIAEIHGAECGAASKKDGGSRFWFLMKNNDPESISEPLS